MARLEFPRETGLILRCAGKAGNPFQTTQGNRLSCSGQEGRRGSEEAVPGPSVFPSREPGVSGDFWGSQEGCQGRTTGGFLLVQVPRLGNSMWTSEPFLLKQDLCCCGFLSAVDHCI